MDAPRPGGQRRLTGADFDLRALHEALDTERRARGLTWAALAREIAGPTDPGQRTIAASSFSGMATRGAVQGNVVMAALRWLDRTPESFVPDHPDAVTKPPLPSDLPRRFYRRWKLHDLHAALDERRRQHDLTWADVARQIGVPASTLTSYAEPDTFVAFPGIMRVMRWLGRPLTDFIERD